MSDRAKREINGSKRHKDKRKEGEVSESPHH